MSRKSFFYKLVYHIFMQWVNNSIINKCHNSEIVLGSGVLQGQCETATLPNKLLPLVLIIDNKLLILLLALKA